MSHFNNSKYIKLRHVMYVLCHAEENIYIIEVGDNFYAILSDNIFFS